MGRIAFLTLLQRRAALLALPLALVMLLAGMPNLLLAAPSHAPSVSAPPDGDSDATILEKRQTPATAAKPKLGGVRSLRPNQQDDKAAVPALSAALPALAPLAGPDDLLAGGAGEPPWPRSHRLPAHTGPPAA